MLYHVKNSTKKRHQIDTGTDTKIDTADKICGLGQGKIWKNRTEIVPDKEN